MSGYKKQQPIHTVQRVGYGTKQIHSGLVSVLFDLIGGIFIATLRPLSF